MSKSASQREREGKPCALCGTKNSTGEGERVLPDAVRTALFPENDGYTTPPRYLRPHKQVDSINLPCCRDCNVGKLQKNFEQRGQAPALKMLRGLETPVYGAEARATALWFLKTWLLHVHPAAEYRHRTPRPEPWYSAPTEVFSWLIEDEPKPPVNLTMWVFGCPPEPLSESGDLTRSINIAAGTFSLQYRIARVNGILLYNADQRPEIGGLEKELQGLNPSPGRFKMTMHRKKVNILTSSSR